MAQNRKVELRAESLCAELRHQQQLRRSSTDSRNVSLDKKADQYTGTFKINQFDPSGNLLAEVVGNITAIRITVNTTVQQVL